MNRNPGLVAAAVLTLGLVAACGSSPGTSVPSLSGTSVNATVSHGSASQSAALHAAAQCIRDHGVPAYQDPVVAPDGSVYVDTRSPEQASGGNQAFYDRIRAACQPLFDAAHFNPTSEPRATPALVAAGVRVAECMRAHGLPNFTDPTAATPFSPGHGFSEEPGELPPGGKTNPVVQRARTACDAQIQAELNVSSLASLSHG